MLVLTRKYQEKIRIGNDITITVLRTKGKAVRLGIEAPSTIPVIRGELTFENHTADADSLNDALVASTEASGTRQRDVDSEPSWTTKPRSRSAGRGRVASPAAEVGHRRIPRDKVPELMPRLVSGNAPLRALMDQRAATL